MFDAKSILDAERKRQTRPASERAAKRLDAGAKLDALAADELQAVLDAPAKAQGKRKPMFTADGQRLGKVALWK